LHFKNNGFEITGSASHGDGLCRVHGYINYEVFEGCNRGASVVFPNPDFEIPKVNMQDFGLMYEAYFLPRDQYFSESGGNWGTVPVIEHFENPDLITHILIHPQWWAL